MRKNNAGTRAGNKFQNKDTNKFFMLYRLVSDEDDRKLYEEILIKTRPIWEQLPEHADPEDLLDVAYVYAKDGNDYSEASPDIIDFWPQMRCAVDEIMAGRARI